MNGHITLLMIAATQGSQSMVEHLLALGADRTVRDADGMTAADNARSSGHDGLVTLLQD